MAEEQPPGDRGPGGGPPAGGGSPPPPGPEETIGRAGGTAPAGATSAEAEEAEARQRDALSQRIQFGRAAVLPQFNAPEGRRALGLPADENLAGDYMVELNVSHRGGIRAASRRFLKLHELVVKDPKGRPATPVGRTYYHCQLDVSEWRGIIDADENLSAEDLAPRAGGSPGVAPDDERGTDGKIKVERRAIYRLWPDFQIKAQINHSVATVKADAALLSYSASGKGIVWAVLDSGIDATHPHFGLEGRNHTLLDPAVVDLHRDFTDLTLEDPDVDPDVSEGDRQIRLNRHRSGALTDDFHHGTHVAGIIAGGLAERTAPQVKVR